MEWLGLEGTSKDHLVQPLVKSRDIFTWIRLLRAPSDLAWNGSRDGASPTSLGNLGQGFTTLTVKNFFLISSLNLPSFSLKPFPLALSLQALRKSLSPSSLEDPFKHCQAAQPQLSQPFLPAEGFQPSDHCWGLLWPRSSSSSSLLCWGLQSWTQGCRSNPFLGWCCLFLGDKFFVGKKSSKGADFKVCGEEVVAQIPVAFSTSLSLENLSLASPLQLLKRLLRVALCEGLVWEAGECVGVVFFFFS